MKSAVRRWGWFVLLTALTLPAVWSLALTPYFNSDDGVLHLYRVPSLDEAIRQGILYPRLFPSFAFGYGQAILSYYGPFSYYAAVLIHWLGVDYADALKWTFALGYTVSGWTAYLLARRFAPPPAALAGAVVYIYLPYHLVETYQRGAIAEHLAWIFLPLILWLCTPAPGQSGGLLKRGLLLAVCMAGLIVTHNLTALMFMPVVPAYYWVMTPQISLRRRIAFIGLSLAGALTLSMFYWLPALGQSRWLEVSTNLEGEFTPRVAPLATFVQPALIFEYATKREEGFPDHPLGLPSFLLLCASAVMLARLWRRRDEFARPLGAFLGLNLLSIFMMLDLSEPLWHAFRNPLAFLQFPWRFMTFVGLGIAMTTAMLVRQHARVALVLAPLLIAASILGLRVRPLNETASDELAMWRFDFRVGQIGTTWTAEYMPLWVLTDRTQIPRAISAPASASYAPPARLSLVDAGYTLRRFRVQSDAPTTLRLHQFYLPQWRATLDGRTLRTFPSSALGLLSIDLPPTQDGLLEIDFDATTLERLGLAASWVSLIALIALTRNRWVYGAAMVCLAGGIGYTMVQTASMPPIQPVSAQFEDAADLVAVRADLTPLRPGGSMRLTLVWQARRETRENLRAFVHLTDAATNRIIAQSDISPGSYTPTSQWRTGEVIEDTRTITIPADAPVGTLQIYAGLYRNPPIQNLSAVRDGRAIPDGRVAIGTVQIVAR